MKNFDLKKFKIVFWILACLLVIYIFYNLFLLIKAWFNRVKDSPLDYNIANCRISDADAKNQADEMYRAMFKPGTDEATIFNILKGKNKDELIQIYNQFGTRLYINWFISGFAKTVRYITLFRWFDEEFEGTDLQTLKTIYLKTGIPW